MSWLKWEIQRGVRNGIGRAIGNAVEQAVRPAAKRVAEQNIAPEVNQAADTLNQAAGQIPAQPQQDTGNLTGALYHFQNAMIGVANEAAKNMKICPACGQGATADKVYCPSCGAQLPEQTLAQSAVCPGCGHQNDVGTKFCAAGGGWWGYNGKWYISISYSEGTTIIDHVTELPDLSSILG